MLNKIAIGFFLFLINNELKGHEFDVFPISTEIQIGKIQPMLAKAPPGILIEIGGERSFRVLSMLPQATKAYFLDIAPEIIRFNQINVELLKAPDLKTYLKLRWESPFSDWQKYSAGLTQDDFQWWEEHIRDLEKMNYPLPEVLNKFGEWPYQKRFSSISSKLYKIYSQINLMKNIHFSQDEFLKRANWNQVRKAQKDLPEELKISKEDWIWWEQYGRNQEMMCSKLWLEKPGEAVDLGKVLDYKTGNYLFAEELYNRLHNFAAEDKIKVVQLNLADQSELENFLHSLKTNNEIISVLDLDNLYWEDYLGEDIYLKVLKSFLEFGKQDSLLVVMNNAKEFACGQFQIYLGFTFENIKHWPPFFKFQSFFQTIPDALNSLIDGHVYEKSEQPPYQYLLGE